MSRTWTLCVAVAVMVFCLIAAVPVEARTNDWITPGFLRITATDNPNYVTRNNIPGVGLFWMVDLRGIAAIPHDANDVPVISGVGMTGNGYYTLSNYPGLKFDEEGRATDGVNNVHLLWGGMRYLLDFYTGLFQDADNYMTVNNGVLTFSMAPPLGTVGVSATSSRIKEVMIWWNGPCPWPA